MPLPALTQVPHPSRWKGKERDLSGRDDDNSVTQGAVINLTLITDSQYQSTYVAPIFLGQGLAKYFVQVDTGSSDLWLASTQCFTNPCKAASDARYDSSQSQPTGRNVSIPYAEGEADGPIVWDSVQLGAYSIGHQALIAASNVNNEPLSSLFSGVMGLALPLNSVISRQLPTATNDVPDGASLSSNLFSITPIDDAPAARFFSLALERPGSDRIPSVLGIGHHPQQIVPDPTKIQYATVVSSGVGTLFWQATVKAINVYVNGNPKPVSLPTSVVPGATACSAILDSGVPLIVTTTAIANGIYGAMGIGPANDGNYYVPCTTALNISIQLDSRSELFLHPLDITTYPPSDATSDTCIGLIQTPASIPGLTFGNSADMILGVPFLRNAYFVMAYDSPYPNGTFPSNSANADSVDSIRPRLGLMNLTDPVLAAQEFYQVRVLKKPLGNSQTTTSSHAKGLSVGVEVLIALLGFLGLCFVLFTTRWAYMRRKYKRERAAAAALDGDSKDPAYVLSALGYKPRPGEPTEDELRQRRFEAYKRRQMNSQYTDDTAITHVDDAPYNPYNKDGADEFGALKVRDSSGTPPEDYDPWGDTLVASPAPNHLQAPNAANDRLAPPPRTARRSELSLRSTHHRTHSGGPSPEMPLLAHSRMDSSPSVHLRDSDATLFMEPPLTPNSMAGVGRRRISSMADSVMTMGSGSPPGEHFPRASYHSRTGSGVSGVPLSLNTRAGSSRRVSTSTHVAVAVPAPVLAVEPPVASVSVSERVRVMSDSSQNNSRVSEIGHES